MILLPGLQLQPRPKVSVRDRLRRELRKMLDAKLREWQMNAVHSFPQLTSIPGEVAALGHWGGSRAADGGARGTTENSG